jgi:hypothetical protein
VLDVVQDSRGVAPLPLVTVRPHRNAGKLHEGMRQDSLIAALYVGDRYPSRRWRQQTAKTFLRYARLVPVIANATPDFGVKRFDLRSHAYGMANKYTIVKRYLRQ